MTPTRNCEFLDRRERCKMQIACSIPVDLECGNANHLMNIMNSIITRRVFCKKQKRRPRWSTERLIPRGNEGQTRTTCICIYSGESANAFLDHCHSPFHSGFRRKKTLKRDSKSRPKHMNSARDSRKLMFVRFSSVSLYY